jgi:putative iron-regulated protein
LLWGQDLTAPAANLPGMRPYTDYLVTGGTASNQARRAQYLNLCADLLTDHLQTLASAWQQGGAYRGTFLSMDPDIALKNIFTGMATLAAAELAVERMDVALFNQDQEDEHSCFSDNTHRDIARNLQGIINVYQGQYGTINGPGIDDLVRQASPTTADDTDAAVSTAVSDVAAIAIPFDYAISGGPTSAEGQKVKTAVQQLQTLGAELIAGASALGIQVNAG